MRRRHGIAAILMIGLVQAAAAARAADGASLSDEPLDCLIEASATRKLGAAVAGLIRAVHVDRGDVVKKGDVVAELDSDVEEATLAAARSRAANDTPISSGKTRMGFLMRKFNRMQTLRATNAVSEATHDEAETEARVAALAVHEAELNFEMAQSEMRRAEAVVQQRRITSPIDGVVVERSLGAGEYRHEQASILTIAQIDPLHVEVFVPIAFYGQTRVGGLAVIEPEKPVGGRHQATVTVVDRVLDAASGTFGVRLALPNPGNVLPAGLRCKVRFQASNEVSRKDR